MAEPRDFALPLRVRPEPVLKVELVLDARATIGESALWVAEENALYWSDIKAPALYKISLDGAQTTSWSLPADIGAFALDGGGRALVALRTGLFWLNLATESLTRVAAAPFDSNVIRFNEGACDSKGRFWIGVMVDPLDHPAGNELGALYSFRSDEGLVSHPDFCALTNGMAWNADETCFYLSHSYERQIYSFAYDEGRLGTSTKFAYVAEPHGIPDGAAMDVEGGYWCAIHGAGCLHRYTQNGRLDRVISLPASQPTTCCFAGAALDELYITTAREKLTLDQLKAEPYAGGVFRVRPGVSGQPKHWRVT